jgi:hypothetical protein
VSRWLAAAVLLGAAGRAAAEIPPDSAFAPWFSSRGVTVEIARMPAGPPWIRGRGEIPAPAAKVSAALADFGRYRDLFAPGVARRPGPVFPRAAPPPRLDGSRKMKGVAAL